MQAGSKVTDYGASLLSQAGSKMNLTGLPGAIPAFSPPNTPKPRSSNIETGRFPGSDIETSDCRPHE
jgi:hypothetical protein